MHIDIRIDMCADMRTNMHIDMRIDMHIGMCMDMRIDMCTDTCADLCMNMCSCHRKAPFQSLQQLKCPCNVDTNAYTHGFYTCRPTCLRACLYTRLQEVQLSIVRRTGTILSKLWGKNGSIGYSPCVETCV